MADPQRVLRPRDYTNYRNVRAVAVLFMLVGVIYVVGGVQIVLGIARTRTDVPRLVGAAFAVAGLAGLVGGIAILSGARRAARFAYVFAGLYLIAFPIGTILGCVVLTGLGRYLDSLDRLHRVDKLTDAGDRDDDWDVPRRRRHQRDRDG